MTYASTNRFTERYDQCMDLIAPQHKAVFQSALIGAMSPFLSEAEVKRCIEIALETSQNFVPRLELVKR